MSHSTCFVLLVAWLFFCSANILLDGLHNAKLSDFGVAKLVSKGDQTDLIGDQTVVGTTAYMAPEVRRGKVTEKSDAYSFGIVSIFLKILKLEDTSAMHTTWELYYNFLLQH